MPNRTPQPGAYPRLVLLTNGKVFLASPGADRPISSIPPPTRGLSWPPPSSVLDTAAPYVLLPGLEKVLVAGGSLDKPAAGPATNTAEVIDFSVPTPVWNYSGPMTYARQNANLVLLADGTVLAVGGGGGLGTWFIR